MFYSIFLNVTIRDRILRFANMPRFYLSVFVTFIFFFIRNSPELLLPWKSCIAISYFLLYRCVGTSSSPGIRPRLISGWPKTAFSPAKIMSHIIANSQPPPKAYPLTAAIIWDEKQKYSKHPQPTFLFETKNKAQRKEGQQTFIGDAKTNTGERMATSGYLREDTKDKKRTATSVRFGYPESALVHS